MKNATQANLSISQPETAVLGTVIILRKWSVILNKHKLGTVICLLYIWENERCDAFILLYKSNTDSLLSCRLMHSAKISKSSMLTVNFISSNFHSWHRQPLYQGVQITLGWDKSIEQFSNWYHLQSRWHRGHFVWDLHTNKSATECGVHSIVKCPPCLM